MTRAVGGPDWGRRAAEQTRAEQGREADPEESVGQVRLSCRALFHPLFLVHTSD